MKKYTIELTEDEMIRYYANKFIEDSLENCSEYSYIISTDDYENSEFIEQHKNEILDRLNKDERVSEAYIDTSWNNICFNMTFWLDYCPSYSEEYYLSPEQEEKYLKIFLKKELEPITDYIIMTTTRNLIKDFMDRYIEPNDEIDFDTKDDIYGCLKEHIYNTGFVEKYKDKYEVYINKENINELIEGIEMEIDKIHIKEYSDIKRITYYNFLELLNKYNKDIDFKTEDLKKFITKENGIYLGINNIDGEMKMQDFDTIDKCLDYLEKDFKYIENLENEEESEGL